MLEAEFHQKRPSIVQIMKAIRKGIAEGATVIHITWGENQIRLEKADSWFVHERPWIGEGWIGKHGGWDIAKKINEELRS